MFIHNLQVDESAKIQYSIFSYCKIGIGGYKIVSLYLLRDKNIFPLKGVRTLLSAYGKNTGESGTKKLCPQCLWIPPIQHAPDWSAPCRTIFTLSFGNTASAVVPSPFTFVVSKNVKRTKNSDTLGIFCL